MTLAPFLEIWGKIDRLLDDDDALGSRNLNMRSSITLLYLPWAVSTDFPHADMPRGSQKSDTAQKKPRTYATGGGDATASGVNFQAHLGAITAVSLLTERPLDTRFGLGSARAIALRMETEAPLDDVLVETSDHGFVAMQAAARQSG